MTLHDLTKKQAEIFDFIKQCVQLKGFPPTLREIATQFRFRSVNSASDHLKALEKKGYIKRPKDMFRALEVLTWMDDEYDHNVAIRNIPLLGCISAGTPIFAVENMSGHIQIDSTLINAQEAFALRVKGDSMIEASICDGDYVIINRQEHADHGSIVAVMIDEDVTLKKFFPKPTHIELVPANSTLSPIIIKKGEKHIRILGKMVGLIRTL